MTLYLLIALGGALGTVGRYGLGLLMAPNSQDLPWGTIVINILGSFVIGFFGTLTLTNGRYPVPEGARLFVMVGFCGGFTTFSSFSLQTLDLLRSDAIVRGCLNVAISVVLCLCAVSAEHACLCAVSAEHAIAARLNGGAVQVAQLPVEEEA